MGFNAYPRSDWALTVKGQLQVSLHNLLPPPTAGWVVEEVEQGPAPPRRGWVAEATHHSVEAARCVLRMEVLQDSVPPAESLEEWSEYTVQRWVWGQESAVSKQALPLQSVS